MNLLDYLITFGGIYLIYAAVMMKVKGEIIKSVINVLVSPNLDLDRIRDREGFIHYLWIRALGIGILAVVIGGFGIVGPKMEATFMLGMVLGYFVLLVWLGLVSAQARKKFLD